MVHKCVGVLTENFLGLPCLQRTNWHRDRPRLRVSMRLGRVNVTLSVFPSRDGYVMGRDIRFGQPVPEAVRDFYRFPVNVFDPLEGQQVLQMRLDRDETGMLGQAGAWRWLHTYHGFSEEVWKERMWHEAARRELLHLAWQAFIHRLTLVFDCELEYELLAYGPHCLLELRERSDPWGSVEEDEEFDPDESVKYRDAPELAPGVRELLVKQRVPRSDFDDFVRGYLLPWVQPQLHAITIAEYLGLREHHLVTPEMAQEVALSLDVEYQAKARRRRFQANPDEFHKAVAAAGYGWQQRVARSLNMGETEFVVWMLRHFADKTEHLELSGRALKEAVERHKELGLELLPAEVERLVARLVVECERAHRTGQPRTALRRLEDMVKAVGFRSMEEAQAWARKGKGRGAFSKFLTARAKQATKEAQSAPGPAPAATPAATQRRTRSAG